MDNFVSRGGLKLQHAIENFKVKISNLTVLDVGSSTGGFVDCLLQNGASKVYALDTAYGELAWKLRNDKRVVVMERTNILHLESLPLNPLALKGEGQAFGSEAQARRGEGHADQKVDLITIDAGWTKLELILPIVKKFLKDEGKIIALLKPHYEASKSELIKGVLPQEKAEEVKEKVLSKISELDFKAEQIIDSPILGGAGNKEFLLLLKQK